MPKTSATPKTVVGHDDTAALQAAIDAAAEKACVFFPPGNYYISRIKPKGCTLFAPGGWRASA